ncbi:hypothetical protein PhaeoP97_01258 [Phaeobacter porticola]|uniref:Uncharacterized protein n=1 Tax=Phaeobacter porticola TaxID=1844006 RepID=A0A1L3I3K3_9RHOB|nr:hypothetical protein PhaeoP97_01258 [Phaeobacter porticola]
MLYHKESADKMDANMGVLELICNLAVHIYVQSGIPVNFATSSGSLRAENLTRRCAR